MLSTATVGRGVQRGHPCIWRTFATEANVSENTPAFPPAHYRRQGEQARGRKHGSPSDLQKFKAPDASFAQQTIYVRAWQHPDSMAEAFAILRGVEKKYGRIREFKWVRDSEAPQMYQSILWASFHSLNAFERVPKGGATLHIPKPAIDPLTPGGVGFHELRQLLQAADREIQEEEEYAATGPVMQSVLGGPEVLTIKVERALHDTVFYHNKVEPPEISLGKQSATAHALLDWGGFAPLPAMFGSDSPYTSDKEDIPVDRENLRKVLNMAAQWTGRPDPSFEASPPPPVAANPVAEVTEPVIQSSVEPTTARDTEFLTPAPASSSLNSWTIPEPHIPATKPYPDTTSTDRRPRNSTTTAHDPSPTVQKHKPNANARKQLARAKLRTATKEERRPKEPELITTGKRPKNRLRAEARPEGLKDKVMEVLGKWF